MAQRLVPELLVRDIGASLAFYTGPLDFRVAYDRPGSGFAFVEREGAAIMLEQVSDASWITAPLEHPLGRGINLEIGVGDLAGLHARLREAGVRLFRGPEETWYRAGTRWIGQRQLLVQDPDGYLLRFAESLGEAAAPGEGARSVE